MPDRVRLVTLAAALGGGAAFALVGRPLPLLLGPMFACLVAALLKLPLRGAPGVTAAMRTVLGVAIGTSLTPDVVAGLDEMAASLALVPVFVGLIGAAGYPYFRRLCGFDRPTAYFAAMPGGLQDMLIFGIEAGANPRALSLVHATRVLAIVAAIPALLSFGWGMSFSGAIGAPLSQAPLGELALMVACAVVGWKGGERLGLFGASIIGPLFLSAALSLGGFIHGRPPAEALLAAQFFIGLGVGVRYSGITLDELRRIVVAGLGFCVLLAVLSILFAEGVHLVTGVPLPEAMLAYAPGGQGEMVMLALVSGVDLAFVVTHHLVRMLVVILGAPIFARVAAASRFGRESP
jgi:membrane AbrB-like protein